MRRLPCLLAVLAAAALPASASAKEISKVQACGADGCQTVLKGSSNSDRHTLMDGGPQTSAPAKPGRFYTFRIWIVTDSPDHHEVFSNRWFPEANLLAARDFESGETIWMSPLDSTARALNRAVRGIEAHPASALPASVLAGSKTLQEPRVHLVINPPTGGDDGGGGPSAWAIAAGAGVILLGAGGVLARRRRRHRAAPGVAPAAGS